MDYEKKYKEALERARAYFENENYTEMADVFPELADSEDEKITRAINNMLPFLPDEAYTNNGVTKEGVLNWLEKQKKQKPNKQTEIEIEEAAEKAALEFAYQYPLENGEYGVAKISFMRGAEWQRQQGIVWSEKDEEKKAYDKGFKAAEEFYCGRII